jgi:RNA polymerase sigma-70 factor (ECF subfamily)
MVKRGSMADRPVDEALQRMIADLVPRLRRFALALTGSRADADDLVQAACERALRRGGQLREQARLDAWLYGIMRNLWTDEIRARRVRRHDSLEDAAEVIGTDGAAAADGRVMLATVRKCLDQLSPEHRSILILVCVDGLSYREAAEVLAIPIGTVMSRVARARQDLHATLAARGAPSPNVLSLPTARPRGTIARGSE